MHLRLDRTILRHSLSVAIASLAFALGAAAQGTIPRLAGIAHVALRVHDLAASRTFYQALGYEEAFDLRREGIPYESFLKINDRQFLELYPITAQDPEPAFLHLCFESDDIAGLHDDYTSVGLTPSEVRKAEAGNLLFTMAGPAQPLGPSGADIPQTIEYTQYEPDSLHSNDEGKHLGPDRVADRLLGVWLPMRDPPPRRSSFTPTRLPSNRCPASPRSFICPATPASRWSSSRPAHGIHARIMLDTLNLARALRHLKHENILTAKIPDGTLLTDPDGNQILLLQR